MNRLKILNIIKKTLIKYQNNELDQATFQEIINDTEQISYNETERIYAETELLCYLFKTIPYYRIPDYIAQYISTLYSIAPNDTSSFISSLIESYICEMCTHLNARITTEINAHLYELLCIYFQQNALDSNTTIPKLTKNIISPETLVSFDIASSNTSYTQETLPEFTPKATNLRDDISRFNYRRKVNMENSLRTLTLNFYNEESFNQFKQALNDVFKEYLSINQEDASFLSQYYNEALTKLSKYTNKKWAEQKLEDDSPQFTLILT